ncbi:MULTISPECIES: hypothetical protein [unclassified Bartonella]|uniref:hypothetical protein n=1 Tax=unclassified Bartonella TaxID=2645622 RepID=UPI0035CF6874
MKAILFFIRCFANSDSLHGLASAYSYGICTHSLQYIGKVRCKAIILDAKIKG